MAFPQHHNPLKKKKNVMAMGWVANGSPVLLETASISEQSPEIENKNHLQGSFQLSLFNRYHEWIK